MIVSLPAGRIAYLTFFNYNAAGQLADADAPGPIVRRVYRNGQDATSAEGAGVVILNPQPGEYIARVTASGSDYDTVSVVADASNSGALTMLDIGGYVVAPAELSGSDLQNALVYAVASLPLFENLQSFLNSPAASAAGSSTTSDASASAGGSGAGCSLPTYTCGQGAFGLTVVWTITLDESAPHNWAAAATVKLFVGGDEAAVPVVNGYDASGLSVAQSGDAITVSYTLQPGDTDAPGRYSAWVTASGTDPSGAAWADNRTLGGFRVLAAGETPLGNPSATQAAEI